jgi:hypothetical protein
MQASKYQSLSKKLLQLLIDELHFDGTLDDWQSLFNKGREYLTIAEHSQCQKHTRYPHQVERLHKLGVLKNSKCLNKHCHHLKY